MPNRKPYPSDVSNEEWAFVAPYLALVREDAPQRTHDLREVLNGLRWLVTAGCRRSILMHGAVRTSCPWRYIPHDLPTQGRRSTSKRSDGSKRECSRR